MSTTVTHGEDPKKDPNASHEFQPVECSIGFITFPESQGNRSFGNFGSYWLRLNFILGSVDGVNVPQKSLYDRIQ